MVKIFQVLYHPEQDHRKTPHNFSSFSMESLQLYYADLLYISLHFTFLFFPISFKLLPLCTSELCWSQRSNRLKTCVQVKWLHLWPQTIPSWEHLICSNQMYFYFNGMLFAWGKQCGSPSDVFSFYHFVEKCINPFCFTSGIFLTQPWDFPPLSAALPVAPVQKTKQSNMKLNGPKRCVKNESRSWLQRENSFGTLGLYISISARLYVFQGSCSALCQTAEDVKIWFITLSWIILVRWGNPYIRIKLWLQVLTLSLCLCDLTQGS